MTGRWPRQAWLSLLVIVATLDKTVVSAATITTATYEISDADERMTVAGIGTAFTGETSAESVELTQLTDSRVIPETCAAGSYSTLNSSTCTNCPAGTYSPTASATSQIDCKACNAGTYSGASGASSVGTCVPCLPDEYSTVVGGTSVAVCQQCPLNSYSPSGSQSLSSCVCDPGYSGANGGECIACGANVWCLNGRQNPCPLNSISPVTSSQISQCLCRPGFYGDATVPTVDSATICKVCKENHFCIGGAVNHTEACADGKYSLPGSDDVGDCVCPVHAVSRQMSSVSKQCVCESGYFKMHTPLALLGGWRCELCKPGEFCYDNNNKTCPPFSVSEGEARSVLDCYCRPGFMNATVQTDRELCVDCPPNYYCEGRGAKTRCKTNAVSPIQSINASRCFCDWGWKGVENAVCQACVSPTFCYSGILAQCSEGTYSKPYSWDRTNCSCIPGRWGPSGGPCVKCPTGKYNLLPGCVACTSEVDTDCNKCEEGTASNVEGRDSPCTPCTNGTYSGPAGAIECIQCPKGTYSRAKASVCTKCALGWYAAQGSVVCTPCPRDTYLNREGMGSVTDCQPCPSGTISAILGNSNSACSACPPGTYQSNGECVSCPAGTYSRSTSVSCISCLPGTYSTERATVCDECDVGSYASGNQSTECMFCTPGTYSEYPGSSTCTQCAVGYYVEYQGADTCTMCNRGEFAATGSSEVCSVVTVCVVYYPI